MKCLFSIKITKFTIKFCMLYRSLVKFTPIPTNYGHREPSYYHSIHWSVLMPTNHNSETTRRKTSYLLKSMKLRILQNRIKASWNFDFPSFWILTSTWSQWWAQVTINSLRMTFFNKKTDENRDRRRRLIVIN